MKKTIVSLSILALILTSCGKGTDPYLVQNQNVGLLTDSTQVKELKTIYANDSIISPIAGDEFSGSINTIEVYEKGGKHLLSIIPKTITGFYFNNIKHQV